MIVTLTDAKTHLNLSSAANDAELQAFLDSAEELVAEETRTYSVASYTETRPVDCGVAFLSHTPVVSVVSVTAPGETITGFTIHPYGAVSGLDGWREVTIAYTAGGELPQARVRTAVLMVTQRLWETQRGEPSSRLRATTRRSPPGCRAFSAEIRALLGDSRGLGVVV
jgi:hypothetical protein